MTTTLNGVVLNGTQVDFTTPAALFAAGEQGVWYDPSNFSTLYQDSAGTTPVTAVEQPVGKMLDLSGNGNHATQATSAARPTVRVDSNNCYYLSFDGTDDSMATGNINFSATDKMSVFAGIRKLSDAAAGLLAELSAVRFSNAGSFSLFAPSSAAANYLYLQRGSTDPFPATPATTFTAPITNVLAGYGDIAADTNILRVNGTAFTISTSDQGTGNFGTYPLYIGARGGSSLYFNGRLYSLIVRGAASTATQISQTEAYVNYKTRAY